MSKRERAYRRLEYPRGIGSSGIHHALDVLEHLFLHTDTRINLLYLATYWWGCGEHVQFELQYHLQPPSWSPGSTGYFRMRRLSVEMMIS